MLTLNTNQPFAAPTGIEFTLPGLFDEQDLSLISRSMIEPDYQDLIQPEDIEAYYRTLEKESAEEEAAARMEIAHFMAE